MGGGQTGCLLKAVKRSYWDLWERGGWVKCIDGRGADRVPSKGSIAVILGFVGTGQRVEIYRWQGDRQGAF
jgi:hypothetical protein